MKDGRLSGAHGAEPILELASAAEWLEWLRSNHARVPGVLLRIGKKAATRTITYAEALDAALAWGWIDSRKRALDAEAWLQRFSPRKAQSPWSKNNRTRAEALMAAGKMELPGLAEVHRAKRDGRWARAYDGARSSTVPADLGAALARSARALSFFEQLDGANRYAILYRVQTAKSPEARAERIERFVGMCGRHETLHPPRGKAASRATRRSRKPPRTQK